MKTKVEIEGYEIEIEFENGVISVKAEKDDEVVEEFTIQTEEGQEDEEGQGSEEIQGFEDFDGEEEDFDGEEFEGEEDEEEDFEGEEEVQGALESFQSFINKRK
jgi:hypothetical protein